MTPHNASWLHRAMCVRWLFRAAISWQLSLLLFLAQNGCSGCVQRSFSSPPVRCLPACDCGGRWAEIAVFDCLFLLRWRVSSTRSLDHQELDPWLIMKPSSVWLSLWLLWQRAMRRLIDWSLWSFVLALCHCWLLTLTGYWLESLGVHFWCFVCSAHTDHLSVC